ncbi:hypothetical protein BDF14DRAFT_1860624 [Spinellus fusiger]|nr:hypothetical protein BDF14DRAFT_1860624 [Spinellus fusiger]
MITSHLHQSFLAARQSKVLLSACHPSLGVDPLLWLPMTSLERSRFLRWRMGWLPGKPCPCACGLHRTSRHHLIDYLGVAIYLGVLSTSLPNPIDFVLNQLPMSRPRNNNKTPFWTRVWPVLCCIMVEMNQICLPDGDFKTSLDEDHGALLLKWLPK